MCSDYIRPSQGKRGLLNGARQASPLDFCESVPLENKWTWGGIDVVKWRYLPEFAGGDKNLLRNYKNAWVINHSSSIKEQAKKYGISVILLAGVCWIEVGGDPDWIDSIAYPIRSFDHMADPLLEPFTITKKPELTSMGDVSIQLRRAAEAANLDFAKLNSEQKNQLIECLSDEDVNIAFVAKHLSQLKEVDEVCFLADEELRIIGARYNRGPHLSLEQIKLNTSYGEFILKKKSDLKALLQQ